jgi:hypothetical protein
MKTFPTTIAFLTLGLSLFAGPRDAQWKRVEDAINRGLPKTAITNLEPIIQETLRDKAYAEAVKAIGKKIALEGQIQGNKPEEKITRLETEIVKAPREMVPILETLLAHWYWQYFQQNRWRFMQRTTTSEAPGKDFTTWDLPRLFAEIDKHFRAAFSAETFLKSTPVSAWDDLLQKGTMPDSYRPTLYDFIVHQALDFYSSGEQAGTKAEGEFELSAESPIFDSVARFIDWTPSPESAAPGSTNGLPLESPAQKAIRLYQSLLRFHQNDPAPRFALADADLERLTWGWNTAFGEEKNSRYQSALEHFIQTYADNEISALALEREARLLQQQGDWLKAHELAERGMKSFPRSPGGKLCHNLLSELEAKSIIVSTERVWNGFAGHPTSLSNAPVLTVRYRNINTVHFRAVRYDWEVFLQKRHNRPESLSDAERREVLARAPTLQWSETLTPTTNYLERELSFPAPQTLERGFYFIVASPDPTFKEKGNVIYMTAVWVSDLALVTRTREGQIEGFVLEANSGEPVTGAEISVWHLDNRGNRVADPQLTTDTNGFFALHPINNFGYLLRARHDGRELATDQDLWVYNGSEPEPRPEAQTVFFTDRSIYRPGQTIQYKGICLWVDQAKDNYEVLKGEQITVVFADRNGKEIARQNHQANDYGSFAGSFTAPRDRLMGQMTLRVEGRARGTTGFSVEEYKRPKFQVTLDSPKTAAKLNEKVVLTGHAMSYTGAAIDDSPVRFRIVRQVRMPIWWGWGRGGWPQGESQEIAHGTTRTAVDGSFTVQFVAIPDRKVPEKDEPSFEFEVNADVIDTAGETRSAQHSIRIGYTALEATLEANDWQTAERPIELKLSTKTLDGEPQAAEGTVKVYQLQAPAEVQRAPLTGVQPWRYRGRFDMGEEGATGDTNDLSNPSDWPLGKVVAEQTFATGTNGDAKLSFNLEAGAYRSILETKDRFGKNVTSKLPLQVLKPDAPSLGIKIPHLLAAPDWERQPGEEFVALWGTGYDTGRAFIEIEHRHKLLQRFWTDPGRTQQQIKLAVTEAMRGGFTLHVTQLRENRAYLDSRKVEVPWKNKDLALRWEHFVSKLQPGQKETWTLVIQNRIDEELESSNHTAPITPSLQRSNNLERVVAETVATLYDESLDAFTPHNWPHGFDCFREDGSSAQTQFANSQQNLAEAFGSWEAAYEQVQITYRTFPPDLLGNFWGRMYFGAAGGYPRRGRAVEEVYSKNAVEAQGMAMTAAPPAPLAQKSIQALSIAGAAPGEPELPAHAAASPKPDLAQIIARKNLNETAFFFPQLTSDSNGIVRMNFTMPEALTKWRFMAFAHDASVRSGYLEDHAVTAKDLMVQPNPPRFLREGDIVEFTVKVSNQSDQTKTGTVRLNFNDALTENSADNLLGNLNPDQSFNLPAKESRTVAWRISVPDGCGPLTYKAVGATPTVSDGEEGAVPVLARRILVTESLPLPIRGPATKKFEFTKLLKSGSSKTLRNESLTLQMVSNPSWYAVLALPYLMEFPHECSEQTFNRLYANALARFIAGSDPKIRRVFDLWKNTPALESPLEKNQDLKSVTLEETPWLRNAESESQARHNIGILFDENRLDYETQALMQKLAQMQLPDGSWPWFPGGQGNDYITLYITTGFGRLRHLGVNVEVNQAIRSLQRLDQWMTDEYERIQKAPDPQKYVPGSLDALYLYGRSFFLKDLPVGSAHKKAVEFFLAQSRKFWLQTNCRQTQGHLALALNRFDQLNSANDSTPKSIMASLKERSVSNEEMGMFWRDTELSWWWYRAPIETQALMIEAFDEVAHDSAAVEDCRVWLLKQKQTQDWKTTKATADAVYALLLRGRDLLSSEALVQVRLGGKDFTPVPGAIRNPNSEDRNKSEAAARPEPGTGFYEVRFAPSDIKPSLGDIVVKKVDQGVAWGSLHWQYLEDMAKVTPYEGTPLKLKKTLFTKTNTARGPVLERVKGPVAVGDELVVRVELRVDRDMEYVHLKDQRGSGTEPVNVLSRYKYQDGLAYYESTRDTASHFFIDYLPKGTYVFEYSTRVQLRGQYQTGVAEIQCMYAPEFNSHSESIPLTVN